MFMHMVYNEDKIISFFNIHIYFNLHVLHKKVSINKLSETHSNTCKLSKKKGNMKIWFKINILNSLTYVNIKYMCFCLYQ